MKSKLGNGADVRAAPVRTRSDPNQPVSRVLGIGQTGGVHVMDYQQLIKYVHLHKELYDSTNNKYGDNQRKEVIWRMIGEKLHQPADVCKRTWTNLRDCFRRATRKRTSRGPSAAKTRKWKYEDEMSFLIPYFQERKSRSAPDVYVSDFDSDFSDDEKKNSNAAEEDNSNASASRERPARALSTQEVVLPLERISAERKVQVDRNEVVEAFFRSMAETVKTFAPMRQNMAKAKIFAVVSELELEQLKEEDQFVGCISDQQPEFTYVSRSPTPTRLEPEGNFNLFSVKDEK